MNRERYVRHAAALAQRARRTRLAFAPLVAVAVAALFAASAPAGAAPPDAELLAAGTLCCDDPSRLPFESLPASGDLDFAVDRRSPLFEFQSGRSFFRAFQLPSQGSAYMLELRSFLEEADSPRTARVFFPVMAILTDDFLVSRATDLDALRFDLPVLEQTTAPAYRVQLPVDPMNTRERYVVVFTPAPLVERRDLQVTTPESAAQAARGAFLGASAFGRLRLTLRPAGAAAEPDEAAADGEADAAPMAPATDAP
jgi:hypothetical protein